MPPPLGAWLRALFRDLIPLLQSAALVHVVGGSCPSQRRVPIRPMVFPTMVTVWADDPVHEMAPPWAEAPVAMQPSIRLPSIRALEWAGRIPAPPAAEPFRMVKPLMIGAPPVMSKARPIF